MLNFTAFKSKLVAALNEACRSLADYTFIRRAGPLGQWLEQRLDCRWELSDHKTSATSYLNIEGMEIVVTASEVETPEGFQKSLRFLRSAGSNSGK